MSLIPLPRATKKAIYRWIGLRLNAATSAVGSSNALPYQSFYYNNKLIKGVIDTVAMYHAFGLSTEIKNKSWLDLGCNEGSICLLAAQDGASPVVGVDYNTAYIEKARMRAKEANLGATFQQANVVEFMRECDDFDVVSMMALIRHVQRYLMETKGYSTAKGSRYLAYTSYETLIQGKNNPVWKQQNEFVSNCLAKARRALIVSFNDRSGQILRRPEELTAYFRSLCDRVEKVDTYIPSYQTPRYVVAHVTMRTPSSQSESENRR